MAKFYYLLHVSEVDLSIYSPRGLGNILRIHCSGGSKGVPGTPPAGPNSFIFMQLSAKKNVNTSTLGVDTAQENNSEVIPSNITDPQGE